MSWPWGELGLDGPASLEDVRRAYAQRLKETHPEEDPEGFQRLHQAYQAARQDARRAARSGSPSPEGGSLGRETARVSPPEEEIAPASPTEDKIPAESFDFDALLGPSAPEEGPPPEVWAAWDVSRIVRQTGQEDRRQGRRPHRPPEEPDPFQVHPGETPLQAALRIVHQLLREGCGGSVWTQFLSSPLFLSVGWEQGFLAELIAAFNAYEIRDPSVRAVVLRAYHLEHGRPPKKQQALYKAVSGQPVPKKASDSRKGGRLWKLAGVVGLLVAVGATVFFSTAPSRQTRQQCQETLAWLQEDLGQAVSSYYLEGYSALYAQRYHLTDWPEVQFTVALQGERDLSQGQTGYTTNFGDRMVAATMETLEDQLDLWLLERTLPSGGTYYEIRPDLTGEGEAMAILALTIEELAAQPWWTYTPPDFVLALTYSGVDLFTYQPSDGPFSRLALVEAYDQAPITVYGQVVEESGMADLDFGGAPHHYQWVGEVEVNGWPYDLMVGIDDATGAVVRYYYKDAFTLRSVVPEDAPANGPEGYDNMEFRHGLPPFETDAEIVEDLHLRLARKP